MRIPRLLLATAIAGTVVASGISGAVEAAPKRPCSAKVQDVSTKANHWQAIRPTWTRGPSQVLQVVAVRYVPDRMLATNGSEVMQSDNGGCDWHLPTPPPSGGSLGVLPAPADDVLKLPST